MNYSFLTEKVATGENQTYLDWIISGALYTVSISAVAFLIAMSIGIVLGSFRTTSGFKKKFADGYFEVVRSIPFIAQLFIAYFVLPSVFFPEAIKSIDNQTFVIVVGTISLGIFMSVRIIAQVYAGINALSSGQKMAGLALGFSTFKIYTLFLLPQALRNIMPTITSEAMNTIKNSAVLSTIGLAELTLQSQSIIDYTALPLEAFSCIIVGYLIINYVVLGIMKLIEKKVKLKWN